jgi:hypothetical protein
MTKTAAALAAAATYAYDAAVDAYCDPDSDVYDDADVLALAAAALAAAKLAAA